MISLFLYFLFHFNLLIIIISNYHYYFFYYFFLFFTFFLIFNFFSYQIISFVWIVYHYWPILVFEDYFCIKFPTAKNTFLFLIKLALKKGSLSVENIEKPRVTFVLAVLLSMFIKLNHNIDIVIEKFIHLDGFQPPRKIVTCLVKKRKIASVSTIRAASALTTAPLFFNCPHPPSPFYQSDGENETFNGRRLITNLVCPK